MKPLRKRSDSSRRGGICLRNKKCTLTFFLLLLFPDFIYHHLFPSNRHITEIQALQSKQKKEVEDLYARMGKARPSIVASSPVAVAGGRRRLTKSKSNKSSRSGSTHSSPHQQGIPPSYFSTKTLYSLYSRSQWQIPVFEHFFSCALQEINVTNRLQLLSQLQERFQILWIHSVRMLHQKVKVLASFLFLRDC